MRIVLLFFLGPWLSNCSKVKTLSTSQLKSKIDSANFKYAPSSDLLPSEFNSPALENEYCNYTNRNIHVSVLRLRDNQAFIYETYYKPYSWARIDFRVGNYRISGDTIYVTYRPLLKGDPEYIYLRPTLSVSWIPPKPPDYLLLNRGRLHDPVGRKYRKIEKLGFNYNDNLTLEYDRRKQVELGNEDENAPRLFGYRDLKGLSGGGIWLSVAGKKPDTYKYILIGIMIEERIDRGFIIGTKVNHIKEYL